MQPCFINALNVCLSISASATMHCLLPLRLACLAVATRERNVEHCTAFASPFSFFVMNLGY